MKYAISPLIRDVNFPPISEVQEWLAEVTPSPERPLIDLCQAVPDYPPAPELLAHLAEHLYDPATARYSPDEGLPEVRRAVAERYARVYGAGPAPGELCLTIGASQAFWLAMMVLCQAGDEVIVQTPYYFDHDMALAMLGIHRVYAPFDESSGGLPDPAVIAGLVTPRTRAILLVSPSNPTGVVTPPAILDALFELARDRGIALVLDETYADFIAAGPPHDLFRRPDWGDHLVHLMSFGKSYALTGYRAGLLAASAPFIREALKAQDTMAVCQPRLTQHAVAYGVNHLDGWVATNRDMMARRHDTFRAAFGAPGNRFRLVASGAFFGWLRHPFSDETGRQVARRLVREHGLLTLPGEVFGPGLEGYLRVAFGNIREEQIPAAAARFRAAAG